MTDSMPMYRTHQVWVKPGHRLFAFLDQACQNAKNLYNMTNFYIRQVFTSLQSVFLSHPAPDAHWDDPV